MRWLTAIARTPLAVGRDLGGHIGQGLLRRGVRGILQPRHRAPAVVIPHDTGEADDGPCGLMRDEPLVLGEFDGVLGEVGAQHDGGHCAWSLPAS